MKRYKREANGNITDTTLNIIGIHPRSRFWKDYQEWLLEGNTPDPEFSPDEIAQAEQANCDHANRNYLADTDWYVIRSIERGIPVPANITAARLEAAHSVGR